LKIEITSRLGDDAAIPQAARLKSSGLMQRRGNGKTSSNDNGYDNSAAPEKAGFITRLFRCPRQQPRISVLYSTKHSTVIFHLMVSAYLRSVTSPAEMTLTPFSVSILKAPF
jgi:hypothetical protein